VHAVSVSLDGFMAGPHQSRDDPLGVGGMALHEWIFPTRTFHAMVGRPGGETGADDDLVAAGFANIGATVMGRNMFGPVRGPWDDDAWTGWWGDTPPFGHEVFVLTHHRRPPLEMAGGTTFHFVSDGVEAALTRARVAAGDRDVRVGGGASVLRQCLAAGLIDVMHVAVAPVVLGAGERLFGADSTGADAPGYRCVRLPSPGPAAHFRLERVRSGAA
jgi:dihydrofolate reductase